MPTWILPAFNFISQRFLHFVVYALIGLLTIGIPYKLFVKPDSKTVIQSGGRQVIIQGEKEIPLAGCSIWKVKFKAVWQ